jgi:hypothetical protein
LIYFGHGFLPQLTDNNSQSYRKHNAAANQDYVVQQGITDNHPNIAAAEEKSEVIKAHPGTGDEAVYETTLDLVIDKGEKNSEHGQITEKDIPNYRRQREYRYMGIVFCPGLFMELVFNRPHYNTSFLRKSA